MYYESMLVKAETNANIRIREKPLKYGLKGLYKNGRIIIHDGLTYTEKACILAEELGHHYTSVGNILDQNMIDNRKQERIAREWAHRQLIPIQKIVDAHKLGIRNRHELASYLEVTEEFLQEAVDRLKEKHGKSYRHGDYIIYFEPLGVRSIDEP